MGTLDVVLVLSPLAASNCCEDLPPRDAQAQTAQVLRLRPGRIRLTEYRFRSVERGCCQPRQRPSLLRPSMCQACRRIDVCFWRLAADVRTADMGRKADPSLRTLLYFRALPPMKATFHHLENGRRSNQQGRDGERQCATAEFAAETTLSPPFARSLPLNCWQNRLSY